jgi:hypothetical protein
MYNVHMSPGNRKKKANAKATVMTMADLESELPVGRLYAPQCSEEALVGPGLLPGQMANSLARIGRGQAISN